MFGKYLTTSQALFIQIIWSSNFRDNLYRYNQFETRIAHGCYGSAQVLVGFMLLILVSYMSWVPWCDVIYDFRVNTMFGSSFRDSKRNFVMRNKTVLGPRGIHSKWVVSNKNFQSLDLKDSKYMVYNAMMAFLITM